MQPFFEHIVNRSFGRVGCSGNGFDAKSLFQEFADERFFVGGYAVGFRACGERLIAVFAAKAARFAFVFSPIDDGLDLLAKGAGRGGMVHEKRIPQNYVKSTELKL